MLFVFTVTFLLAPLLAPLEAVFAVAAETAPVAAVAVAAAPIVVVVAAEAGAKGTTPPAAARVETWGHTFLSSKLATYTNCNSILPVDSNQQSYDRTNN